MTNIPMTMVLQTTQDVRYLGSLRSEVTFIVATSELNMFCGIFANTGEFLRNFLKSQLGNAFCQHFFHLIAYRFNLTVFKKKFDIFPPNPSQHWKLFNIRSNVIRKSTLLHYFSVLSGEFNETFPSFRSVQ